MGYTKAEVLSMDKAEWDFMIYSAKRGGEERISQVRAGFEESPTP